ncbi:MAG: hypothetical protein NTV62_00120 [Candidatus Gribaldobacteria bacterium]|nr:hypothetical protein [Candidatus Gribaldobacteria bacterium]
MRFRIRQGKLKAKKIGRNWLTTKDWLDEYLQKVSDYRAHLVALKSEDAEVIESPEEETLPVEAPELPEILEEPQMNEEVGPLAIMAEKDEPEEQPIEEEEKEDEEEYDAEDNGLIYQAKKPSQNSVHNNATDDKIRLLFDPQPLAVFQEAELEAQEGARWPALAFALLFLCGVLGFMAGFKYSAFEPLLAQAKDATVKEAQLLVSNLTSPILAEQFTASFGIIMERVFSPTQKPAIQVPKIIKNEISPIPPLPVEPSDDVTPPLEIITN